MLILATNVVAGLEVREPVITRHLAAQMPFMATERWMMLGVESGGDRQVLHEAIRSLSQSVAEQVSAGGPNDLMQRLAAHPLFARVSRTAFGAELDPARYTGRSAAQVAEFLGEYLTPLLARAAGFTTPASAEEVRV
jgi:adenylosuccinate lyase